MEEKYILPAIKRSVELSKTIYLRQTIAAINKANCKKTLQSPTLTVTLTKHLSSPHCPTFKPHPIIISTWCVIINSTCYLSQSVWSITWHCNSCWMFHLTLSLFRFCFVFVSVQNASYIFLCVQVVSCCNPSKSFISGMQRLIDVLTLKTLTDHLLVVLNTV